MFIVKTAADFRAPFGAAYTLARRIFHPYGVGDVAISIL